jgi:DHA2 family multidrug resistance protein
MGISGLLLMPLWGVLLKRVDIRAVLAFAFALGVISCFTGIDLSPVTGGAQFLWPQLFRGAAQGLMVIAMTQASTDALPLEDVADGSGLFNVARNLGGSIGLAFVGVWIDRRFVFHGEQMTARLSANSLAAQEKLGALTQHLLSQTGDPAAAHARALALIAGEIQRQAMIVSYADCFWAIGVALAAVIPLAFFAKHRPGGWQRARSASFSGPDPSHHAPATIL